MVAGGEGNEANGIQATPARMESTPQATKVDEAMTSLYETLAEKLKREGGGGRLGGARADISILLFNYREAIRELWLAGDKGDADGVTEAVEALRPLFGEQK